MSSDEVINQIIRSIVSHSTDVIKSRNEGKIQNSFNENNTVFVSEEAPPKASEEQGISRLFSQGIHTRVEKYQVTDQFAAFMIRAIVLDSQYRFNVENDMSREEVNRLIKICVEKITSDTDFEMETIRMQVYFDTNFPSQSEFLHHEKHSRLEQCSNILRDIIQVKSKAIGSLEAALESVFPNSELISFLSLTRHEKEAQLNGLTNLVTGIRLFNRHLEKGGDTIENYPEYCLVELRELDLLVREETARSENSIQLYKAILDYAHGKKTSEVSEEDAGIFTSGLVFQRQYLLYLDALQQEVNQSHSNLNQLQTAYNDALNNLKFSCKAKSAVPVDQVYPLFISLATTWSKWFNELFFLAFKRGIAESLKKSANKLNIPVSNILDTLCEPFKMEIEPSIIPETEIIENAAALMAHLGMINKNADVIHPGNTTQYYKLPVEFGGFCPYTLISRDGMVVPGDKNIGMVRYKERLFSFVNLQSAIEFFKKPDNYVEDVIQMSRSHPSYVQLLHLYKFFPSIDTLEKAQSYTRHRLMGQLPIVSEVGCQVDTHIEETKIEPSYKWNEWDLRRDALMLVNLKDKQTHSTQTNQSHFRRDSETQHYMPKDNVTQTRKDGSTFVPKTVHYLAGLRNNAKKMPGNMYKRDRRLHFHIRDLTIDLDGNPVPYGGGAYKLPPLSSKKSI